MTSPARREVEPLDFSLKAHRGLLFDLAWNDREHLLNDTDNDPILVIDGYERQEQAGWLHPFVALVDGELAGAVWLETDRYNTGRVHAAFLPEHRTIWNGLFFLRWLVDFSFDLGLRKLDAEFALYSKHDKQSAAFERTLKHIGFNKRAILPEALMVGGEPKDTILLDYLKRDYDVKKERETAHSAGSA